MPNSTINATVNGLNSTAGNVATLDLQVGNSTVASVSSSGIAFPAGSNTAPSIYFTGDTNTGIYSPGSDTIAFTEGGVEAMRIDSSGNVGIGTSSPGAKLELGSGTLLLSNNVFIQQKDSSGNAKNVAGLNSSNQYNIGGLDGSSTVDTVRILTSGTVRATVTSGGDFQFNSGYGSVATAYGCRAWVNFNGTGTVAIRANGNVSSITDNGTGDYTVNFSTAITDANYSFVAFCKTSSGAENRTAFANGDNSNTTQSASSYRFYTTTLAGTPTDTDFINVAVFR